MQDENWEILKYVASKQHDTEQPTCQRNKRKQKIPWDKWKSKYNILKLTGCSESCSKGKIHSDKCLYQNPRNISNK